MNQSFANPRAEEIGETDPLRELQSVFHSGRIQR